jgi:hypothetical protein
MKAQGSRWLLPCIVGGLIAVMVGCTAKHAPPVPTERYLNISRSNVDQVILGPAEGASLQFDRFHARFNGTQPLSLIYRYVPPRMPAPLCRAIQPTGGVRVGTQDGREVIYSSKCRYPPEIHRLVGAMLRAADSDRPAT